MDRPSCREAILKPGLMLKESSNPSQRRWKMEHLVVTGSVRRVPVIYVKMVHNGIEYGDMQLIGEAYHLLKATLGLDADYLHDVFADWNHGELDSYLIEITSHIFSRER